MCSINEAYQVGTRCLRAGLTEWELRQFMAAAMNAAGRDYVKERHAKFDDMT